jgi:hypothetical protein
MSREMICAQPNTFSLFCACCFAVQALGCTIIPVVGTSNSEAYRQHYPMSDGTGCNCYEFYGAKCYATCANVIDYQVVSQYFSGVVNVTCPANTIVLGCGIRPDDTLGPEKNRTCYVMSVNACQCFDYFGATCYATCGQFA